MEMLVVQVKFYLLLVLEQIGWMQIRDHKVHKVQLELKVQQVHKELKVYKV